MVRSLVVVPACSLLLLLAFTSPMQAQVEAPALPHDVGLIPPESAATADEGHSYLFNPAGPAFTRPSSLEFFQIAVPSDQHRGPGDGGRGVYWSLPSYRFGLQYLMLESGYGSGVFGFSNSRLIGKAFAFGTNVNYHWYVNPPTRMPGTFSLRVGFMARPGSRLSLGLTFDSLLSPESNIDELRTVGRFGVAVRPFGERFMLSLDAESQLITLIEVPTASFLVTSRLEPIDGLQVNASFRVRDVVLETLEAADGGTPDLVGSVGVTLRFGKVSLGATNYLAGTDGGTDYSASTVYFGAHGTRFKSALRRGGGRGEVWQVSIAGKLAPPPHDNLLATRPNGFPLLHPVQRLRTALESPRVEGVVLNIDDHEGTLAQMQELRALVIQLREAGKPVFAYLHNPTTKDVYLASACTRVLMHPAGSLRLDPPYYRMYYLKGLLNRLGIEAEILRRGEYKATPEQLIAEAPSEPTEAMKQWVVDDLLDQIVEGIADGRNVSRDQVKGWFHRQLFTAMEAAEAGLVDEVAYPDQLSDLMAATLGSKPLLQLDNKSHDLMETRWGPRSKIGLVYVGGPIVRGEGFAPADMLPRGAVHSGALVRALKRLSLDRAVEAVVIRVESPGGDLLASDEIWRAIQLLREQVPVIVSMGGVAASGGYYVSLPGDVVLADPATLTGSIGVFTGKWNGQGLFDKVGVRIADTHPTEAPAPLNTFSRPWTAHERAVVDRDLDAAYKLFLQKVAQARGLTEDEVRAIGDGRVWTGRQAYQRRLVDRLGGLDDAIQIARDRAGIPDDTPVVYEVWPRRSLRESLLDNLFGEREAAAVGGKVLLRTLEASASSRDTRPALLRVPDLPVTP